MTNTSRPASRKPLRLWPGVAIAVVVVLARYVMVPLAPDAEVFETPLALIGIFAGIFGGLAIALWWLFFSRASWLERIGALVLMFVGGYVTRLVVHESIRGGNMGFMLFIYATPALGVALVCWAVATRQLSDRVRRASLIATIVSVFGIFTLLRTDGSLGAGSQITWRWTATHEERLLAQAEEEPNTPPPPPEPAEAPPAPSASVVETAPAEKAPAHTEPTPEPAAPARVARPAQWPGFRGSERDGVVRGVRIVTDWTASPPAQIWRRPIGPGWSSFAVDGDLIYTQEQRGDDEIVSCYKLSTGEPVWRHRDAVRFWESNAGAGPRATPTLADGRVYAFGATGILNALDARTGKALWSRNVAKDANRRVPDWGFSSSPLVTEDRVIVAASGTLVAYAAATGDQLWVGPRKLGSYSSPHRVTIDGVEQVVLLSGSGALAVAPADGAVLWEHEWPDGGTSIVQPAVTPDGDIIINSIVSTGGIGTRRLSVARGAGGWTVEERWTSNGLKPYFNDFVVHEGHAYGFDGSILACIDLETGTRKWKGGRYGSGQLVLLRDQDALLVISEEGELALVGATPVQYRELARAPALDAKTWNHPAVVGDVLLVRNGEEMAAFRLAVAGR